MKSNYNRNLIATAKSKALTYSRPFAKHKAYRIFCRAAAAFVCRLHTLVCAALILSLLATWTPAVPQTIVALIKESSVSLGRGRSAIPNPQSALTPASDPKVELPSNLLARNNSVKLPEASRPKVDRPLDDSSTPLFAPSVRAAKLYAALMPQGNGYIYRRTITIDHTKVPNSDQTNFPVLISGTYSYLATEGNGGNVKNSNGFDIVFTSDSGCATLLNHEVETYNPTTGAVNYWVNVPTVSHTSDSVFYMCYGNSSISTDQSNKTAVWDSSYKGAWHLPNGTNLTTTDSTANANNSSSNSASATAGVIDGAASYNGSSQYTTISNPGSFDYEYNQPFTVEFWLKKPLNTTTNQVLISKKYVYHTGPGFQVWTWAGSNNALFDLVDSAGTWYEIGSVVNVQDNAWHHIVTAYDGSSNRSGMKMYVDGALTSTGSSAAIANTIRNSHNLTLGTNAGSLGDYFNGSLDEVRFSNSARAADWIKAEFNNQSSPAAFYTISAVGGTGGVVSVFGRTGVVVAATNDYTWAQIDKTTSSLLDIATRSAGDLSSGTLPNGRFPAILPTVSGANLTALNASNLASGTVATARLGSGATSTNFLRGDNTWAVPSGESQWTTLGSNVYYNTGNVGIGTSAPGQRLSVAGTIESTTGGFKFPDGTTQTTAGGSGGGQVFNAAAYGAVCDGFTDDATAFANAISAANTAGGGTVWVPQSTTSCIIGTGITLSAKVSLRGAGMGASTLKRKSTFTSGHIITTGTNSTVSDITVDGNYPARASGTGVEIQQAGDNSTIERIEIKNPYYIGISIGAATNAKILNSVLTGANAQTTEASYAIWAASTAIIRPVVAYNRITNWTVAGIYGGATEMLIEGNYIAGNHTQNVPTGGGQIGAGATGHTTVRNNYIGAGGGPATSGIEADFGPFLIDNNTIVGQTNYGIILQNASPGSNVGHILTNNRVSGSGVSNFTSQIAITAWDGNNNTPSSMNQQNLFGQTEGQVLTITSNTITPTSTIHHVGAGALQTITVPTGFVSGTIYLIPDSAFTYSAAGNIIGSGTAAVGRVMVATYSSSTSKWYMSY